MDKTKISHFIKPGVLKELLRRNGSMLDLPLLLLDGDGREIAEYGNVNRPQSSKHCRAVQPLTVRGQVLGTLVGYETERFRGERLTEVLGDIVKNLVDLVLSEYKLDSMSEELLHNYKVLNLFYNVSNSLVNILNVRKACHIIMERIVDTIGLSRASVLLLDESRRNFMVVAYKGLPGEEVGDRLFRVEKSVCREAIEKAKPLFIQDIDHYPSLKKRSRGRYQSRSFISVPILKSGRPEGREVLGVINVADKTSGEPFYSGDMKLIMALTSLAALSVQNSRYFEEVERSKEEWESTFDAITDTVAILDSNYRLRKVNRAYKSTYGFDQGDLTDRTCYEVFYGKEGPCLGCPVTRTLLTGEPSYTEKRIQGRIIRQWTYPIDKEGRRTSSIVMYTRDVTHLKKLKERLSQSEKMASIGQIAAGMAHEIRNPLGSIVTAVDVLSTGGGTDNENFYTLSEVLTTEAHRLNEIISEFLLYAAPQPPALRDNNLNQVLEEVVQMIQSEAVKNGVEILLDLDPAMDTASFDGDKIKQVIWNIVLNGLESMDGGGTLDVSTKWMGDQMVLRVRDQGRGIPKEDRNKIFDPFYTTRSSGTGLGLSVVSRIVEDHRGSIEVGSQPGKGSEFVVSLPVGKTKVNVGPM